MSLGDYLDLDRHSLTSAKILKETKLPKAELTRIQNHLEFELFLGDEIEGYSCTWVVASSSGGNKEHTVKALTAMRNFIADYMARDPRGVLLKK